METTSPVTEEAVDLSVEGLLATYEVPKSFDVPLPAGGKLVISCPRSYSDQRAFEKERREFVTKRLAEANNAKKENNPNLLAEPYRPYAHLMTEANLAAAFTLHRYSISPQFSPIDALRLCEAGGLMTWIENGISYGQAAFLQERAVELLDEAKKD